MSDYKSAVDNWKMDAAVPQDSDWNGAAGWDDTNGGGGGGGGGDGPAAGGDRACFNCGQEG